MDSVTIGFPLNSDLLSLHDPVWFVHTSYDQKTYKEFEVLTQNVWIGHTNVHVTVRPLFNNCSIAYNAAQMRRPKSLYLLDPEELSDVVEEVLDGVRHLLSGSFDYLNQGSGEYIRRPDWRSMVRFERLDLARNLFIPSPSELALVKAAIAKVTPRNMKKKTNTESTKKGWTVTNDTAGVGMDRIYDKHAQLLTQRGAEQALPGTLRFETQLEANRLKAPVHVKTLDKLTRKAAWEALENRWKACKWGVPIMKGNSIYAAISGESEAVQDGLLGFMMKMADGLSAQMDPRRLHTMTKKALSLGLVPGMPIQAQGLVSKVLDLKAGGLIDIQ